MKKTIVGTVLLMLCIAVTSCSDKEFPNEKVSMRDYQTDAKVLSRFVDVNKTLGEYFINENMKNSPASYITDTDWQELQKVNPVNKAKFENDLKALNSMLEMAAKRSDVSQIVFNTQSGGTYIKEIDHDAPFKIEKSNLKEASTRSNYGRLNLLYNSEQWQNFYAGNRIYTRIDINLFGYTYYFFEIICDTNASKSGSGGGNNPKTIVMSGTTSYESWQFTWTENSGSTNVYWQFRGKRSAPQSSGGQITAEFYD